MTEMVAEGVGKNKVGAVSLLLLPMLKGICCFSNCYHCRKKVFFSKKAKDNIGFCSLYIFYT